MRLDSRFTSIALLFGCSVSVGAQQRPAIRQLGATSAKSAEKFVNLAGIRTLPNGAVLVNDAGGRRVLLFDPQLSTFKVIADSTSATANAYGGQFGRLVAYRGDSTLFVDPTSVSMLVIDGTGKVARVMAIPRAEDAGAIGGQMGNTAFDASGRLVYRAGAGIRMMGGPGGMRQQIQQAPSGAARPAMPQIPDPPDSAFIIGVNLATRKVDTLGYIRTPKIKLDIQQDERGFRAQSMINPLPVVDDWAVTPDGAIAFVRGRDYHVDWVNSDGTKVSSAKIPFDWKRLTDEDKVAFLDSVKAARERMGPNAPMVAGGPPGAGGAAGGGGQVMVFSQQIGGGGGAPPPQSGAGGPGGGRGMQVTYVPASDLPDYQPAFFAGSTRADNDGNLWIRTIPTTPVSGGPVYDVINRKGEIVERVQVPENRSIIGFGPGGAVYLMNREGTTTTIERASIR